MPRGRIVYRGANVTVWFDFNRKGIAAVAMGPKLRRAVHHVASDVAKPHAIDISPHHSGQYKRSFVVLPATRTIRGLRRAAANLVNISPHALIVEKGNGTTTPAHRVLLKTLQHLHARAAASSGGAALLR